MNKKLLAVLISTSVVLGAHSVSSASEIEVSEPKVEDGVTADTSTEAEMTFEELTEGEDLPSEGSFEAETSNEDETIDNEEIESPVDAMADENFAEITENSEIDSTNGDEDAIIDKVVIELEKIGINPYPWKDGENLEFENRAIKDGTVVEITDGNTTRIFDLKNADARTVKEFADKLNVDNIAISIKEPSDDGKTYYSKTYTKSDAIETPEDDTTENRKLTLTQLYNRDLKVIDQDGNTISLDTSAIVYWDANTAESIKLEDGELKHTNPDKLGSNNEGKIYVDGRPLGIGSIVKSGDAEYEVINFSSDAVNGTTIQFKEYEAKSEDEITTETEIEKREIPFTVTEIKRNDLPEGYKEVVRAGFNGYHIVRVTRTYVNGVEDKSKRTSEIVVTRPAEEEIVLVGTKKDEGTPLAPLIPLTPAKPISPMPPIVDRPLYPVRPIDDAPILVDPIVDGLIDKNDEQVPDPEVDDLIARIEEATREITEVLLENEENQKEIREKEEDKEDKEEKEESKENIDKEKENVKDNSLDENTKPSKDVSDDKKDDEEDAAPVKVPAVEKRLVKVPAKKSSNPKTGVADSSAIIASLMASATALFASRKRK